MFLFFYVFLFLYLCSFALCFEFNVLINLITWYSQSGNTMNGVLFKFVFTLFRSSHHRCFIKKPVLKYFAIFTWKRLCWSLFLIKLQAFRSATLLKADYNRCFPVIIAKCLIITILKNPCERRSLNQDLRPGTLRPRTGTRDPETLGTWDTVPWHTGLWKWVPGTWDMLPRNPESWEQDPENWTYDTDSRYPDLHHRLY